MNKQGRLEYALDSIEYKDWKISWTGRSSGGVDSWVGIHPTIQERLGGTSREYILKCIDWRESNVE